MEAKAVLIAARAKITNRAHWGKGIRAGRASWTFCAAEAIEAVSDPETDARLEAYDALKLAIQYPSSLVEWNDAPERTHNEVLAAFDDAIVFAGPAS